ncbi:DUF554 domain-containing protein [Candidatus Cloacimonadota bacterium]
MLGTIINVGTIVAGSLIGLLFHSKIPEKVTERAFQGIGLFTIFLGIKLALQTTNFLIMIFSLVLGAILGEIIDIDKQLNKGADKLKVKLSSTNNRFSEGLITSFLLFCMGSMTILGAIEEGLGGKPDLLIAKSILDGFGSIAFASVMGIGVMFSVIPLLIYQGGLTILARIAGEHLSELAVNEMSAVGGILLIGLGITVLKIKEIKILNMLPALLLALVFTLILK